MNSLKAQNHVKLKFSQGKQSLRLETFSLSNADCRHLKVLNLLNKNGFKTLEALKMIQVSVAYPRLKQPLETFKERNSGLVLKSTGVQFPSDVAGKTPLDNVSCISETFKRIKKGSGFYRRMLRIQ